MNLMYKNGTSTNKPNDIDSTSSKTVTYIYKDIKEKTVTDDEGNTYKVYTYKVATLTKEEYKQYLLELNSESVTRDVETLKESSASLDEKTDELQMYTASLETVLDDLISNVIPDILGMTEE